MLNEIYPMSLALKKSGLGISELSPMVFEVTGKFLRIVRLENGGLKVYYEDVKKGLFWKLMPNNQLTFPAGKLVGPLYKTDPKNRSYQKVFKDKKVSGKEKISLLKDVIAQASFTDNPKIFETFEKGWRRYPEQTAKEFLPLLDDSEPLAKFLKLLTASPSSSTEGASTEEILKKIAEKIIEGLEEGKIPFDEIWPLLVSSKDGAKELKDLEAGKEPSLEKPISFLLDIQPSIFSISEEINFKWRINDILQARLKSGGKASGVCSLTGRPASLVEKNFPQIKLPVFAMKTCLFSMNRDVPAHLRHGKESAEICPVSEETAQEMAQALSRITEEDLKGQTWRRIPASIKNNKPDELFIVYEEENPLSPEEYAQYLSGVDDDDDEERDWASEIQDKITKKTKIPVVMLEGKLPDAVDPHLRCFILREVDPGRRQIVYADQFTVSDLYRSAEKWLRGGENVPKIEYLYSKKKGGSAAYKTAKAPSLSQTVRHFRQHWKSDLQCVDVPGIPFKDFLALFLERPGLRQTPRRLLDLLLRRTQNLLAAVGEGDHIRDHKVRDIPVSAKESALRTIALIGILLDKIAADESEKDQNNRSELASCNKEIYMEETAYNLGRLAMLADKLHIAYCQEVRGGDVPPCLIGNAMVPVLSADPLKGFNRLNGRMLSPYVRWAKQYTSDRSGQAKTNSPNPPGLVRYFLKLLSETAEKIESCDKLSDKPLSEREKAKLYLGYLSQIKASEKKEDTESAAEAESSESESAETAEAAE